MPLNIFYSWQSDSPSRVCRNLIEEALEKAISKIAVDLDVIEAVRDEDIALDRDTKGVPGNPPIFETVLEKIKDALIFVPDFTFVGKTPTGKLTPNPNVLIEYGYALAHHGHTCMIPVMNAAYGDPKEHQLPFDLRHVKFPICFTCPEAADNETKAKIRTNLTSSFVAAIKEILRKKNLLEKKVSNVKFSPRAPAVGRARFRPSKEWLGVTENPIAHVFDKPLTRVRLAPNGAIWLRVIPALKQSKIWSYGETRAALMRSGKSNGIVLPLASSAHGNVDWIRAEDGMGITAKLLPNEYDTRGVVFIFETGELWAIDTHPTSALGPKNMVLSVESYFADALPQYANCLTQLGVQGPLRWEAGIEGVRGHMLCVPQQPGKLAIDTTAGPFLVDEINAEGMYDSAKSAVDHLRPFFETIYDRCGRQRPQFLDGHIEVKRKRRELRTSRARRAESIQVEE